MGQNGVMATLASPTAPPRFSGRTPSVILGLFVLVAVANAVSTAADSSVAHNLTTALLVPLLFVWLLGSSVQPLPTPTKLLAVGLVFAWFGDIALLGTGDVRFITGILMFLVMQVFYILAFRRVPGPGLVRAWPLVVIPYAFVWLLLAIAMWHESGAKAIPGLIYGLVLAAMAISALDLVLRVPRRLGWRVAIGAALFLLSDGLIALSAFAGVASSPGLSTAVMVTYAVAQAMIVTGFVLAVNTANPASLGEE